MLAEGPAGFVVVELTAGNVDAVLARMARLERDFPLARAAVVAERSMADYEWLVREAGAVAFRRVARAAWPAWPSAACRHLDGRLAARGARPSGSGAACRGRAEW